MPRQKKKKNPSPKENGNPPRKRELPRKRKPPKKTGISQWKRESQENGNPQWKREPQRKQTGIPNESVNPKENRREPPQENLPSPNRRRETLSQPNKRRPWFLLLQQSLMTNPKRQYLAPLSLLWTNQKGREKSKHPISLQEWLPDCGQRRAGEAHAN